MVEIADGRIVDACRDLVVARLAVDFCFADTVVGDRHAGTDRKRVTAGTGTYESVAACVRVDLGVVFGNNGNRHAEHAACHDCRVDRVRYRVDRLRPGDPQGDTDRSTAGTIEADPERERLDLGIRACPDDNGATKSNPRRSRYRCARRCAGRGTLRVDL